MTRSGQSGWAGSGWFGQLPFGVHRLLQHARARIEVAVVPAHEIAIQFLADQVAPWEGNSFFAAEVADEFRDQPEEVRSRPGLASSPSSSSSQSPRLLFRGGSWRSRPLASPAPTFPPGRRRHSPRSPPRGFLDEERDAVEQDRIGRVRRSRVFQVVEDLVIEPPSPQTP